MASQSLKHPSLVIFIVIVIGIREKVVAVVAIGFCFFSLPTRCGYWVPQS